MDSNDEQLKIIIIHQDAIAGIYAAGVLNRLVAQLKNRLGIELNPHEFYRHAWQFKWLQQEDLWEQSRAEGIAADMIIISTDNETPLPLRISQWLENVLTSRQNRPAAVVALFTDQTDTTVITSPSRAYLQRVAEQRGVDFFCNLDQPSAWADSAIKSALNESKTDSGTSPEFHPRINEWSGWGLND